MIFNHTGNIGDIIYSIPFVFELCEKYNVKISDTIFNIQINVKTTYSIKHPYGNFLMNEGSAKFLIPFLELFGFKRVTTSLEKPKHCVALEDFRKLKLNTMGSDIRTYYYSTFLEHLPQNFSRKYLNFDVIDNRLKNKIVVCLTNRYLNPYINFGLLEKYKDNFIFVGLESEYINFCKTYFTIDYAKILNCYEAAVVFNSCKGIISNQNGLYSIAETLKVPRILISCEFLKFNNKIKFGPVNVMPFGGWFEIARTNEKLVSSCKELLTL